MYENGVMGSITYHLLCIVHTLSTNKHTINHQKRRSAPTLDTHNSEGNHRSHQVASPLKSAQNLQQKVSWQHFLKIGFWLSHFWARRDFRPHLLVIIMRHRYFLGDRLVCSQYPPDCPETFTTPWQDVYLEDCMLGIVKIGWILAEPKDGLLVLIY